MTALFLVLVGALLGYLTAHRRIEKLTKQRDDAVILQARAYANPKPPKPPVPLGLGAVVKDAAGKKWIRLHVHSEDCNDWYPVRHSMYEPNDLLDHREKGGGRHKYSDIDAVTVLSEGVQP